MGHYRVESLRTVREFGPEFRERTVPAVRNFAAKVAGLTTFVVEFGLNSWVGRPPANTGSGRIPETQVFPRSNDGHSSDIAVQLKMPLFEGWVSHAFDASRNFDVFTPQVTDATDAVEGQGVRDEYCPALYHAVDISPFRQLQLLFTHEKMFSDAVTRVLQEDFHEGSV